MEICTTYLVCFSKLSLLQFDIYLDLFITSIYYRGLMLSLLPGHHSADCYDASYLTSVDLNGVFISAIDFLLAYIKKVEGLTVNN